MMNSGQKHIVLRAAVSSFVACSIAMAQPIVPTDGQVLTSDTTFVTGTYSLPNGVSIGAPGITLDMNGATLIGTSYDNYGVTCIGYDNVVIKNGTIRTYYYGIRVESGAGVQILANHLSNNWVDPASLTPTPPVLNINVGPTLEDRTNLGGGLYMRSASSAMVSGNVLQNQENGIDLYSVSSSTISDNDASNNTGWGIHLYSCTGNTISNNTADSCTRTNLNESAGFLVVYGSSGNQFLNNSFQYGGDGLFLGNEWGCPSNDNLFQGNNGSYAGANAFEATFSSGNQFISNIADGSNYGFWLGYSHDGNVIRANSVRANNTNGIEIEHGQHNTIEGNDIIGNGGAGIVLRTDGQSHFPPGQFPCLNLPDQASSSYYTIRDNRIHGNYGTALVFSDTTDSTIVNNLIGGPLGATAVSNGARNIWSITPTPGTNIVGGPTLGGNWWYNYNGMDNDADGLGDTATPYTNSGQIAAPGDPHPLIGSPDLGQLSNPRTLCDYSWCDIGRNTRGSGAVFDTANGTHFATNGSSLYLLEGNNSRSLSLFDAETNRYISQAIAPEGVQDGGDFQYGGGLYFATVGLTFDANTGAGNGSRLYAYTASTNAWAAKAPTTIAGQLVCNEALAYDAVANRLYATLVRVKNPSAGGDPSLLTKLGVYDVTANTWIGTTSAAPDSWNAGTEAEYLAGRIYVWRGGFNGGAVNGSDSYLDVYHLATDTWTRTPTLQTSAVVPGFRSGAFDVWGVSLAANSARGQILVTGGEANRQLYVFDVASQTWAVGPASPYDGGWGSSMEYVSSSDRVYLIDGRNSGGTPQGTAYLSRTGGDLNCDGHADVGDVAPFALALIDPTGYAAAFPGCDITRADLNCDGLRDGRDILAFVRELTNP